MCLLNRLVFAEKVLLIWSILHCFLNCHIDKCFFYQINTANREFLCDTKISYFTEVL